MTVRAHRVLFHPRLTELNHSGLLVLSRILAHLHEQTGEARPSVSTLIELTGRSERTVQRAIQSIEALGIMEVEAGGGRSRANRYHFKNPANESDTVSSDKPRHQHDGESCDKPRQSCDGDSRGHNDETPSIRHLNPVNSAPKPRHQHDGGTEERRNGDTLRVRTNTPAPNGTSANGHERKRDPLWDAVAAIWFGGGVPKPQAARVGRIVRDLREYSATPEALRIRVDRYRRAWPTTECSPEAIVKHWFRFSEPAQGDVLDAEPVEPPDEVFAELVR